jgi:glycerophosphoryl diester phosphodiesterase
VFAHRCGSALAPENTIAAFDNGVALGADGLELDVHLSRDGVVVVHHDRTLDRTTPLRGPIADRTADELSRAGVPTLADVLTRYREPRVIIEMKVNRAELARATIDVVRAHDAVDRVCLGAFGFAVLRAARALEPAIATSAAREEVRWALYRSWVRWPVSRVGYAGYQVPELAGRTRVVSRRFIESAHGAGLGVQVWTVNTDDDARRLLEWGVDALITDRPDIIVPIVEGEPFRRADARLKASRSGKQT